MTVETAIEIRDRAISHGLKDCCTQCSEAIETLSKLGQREGTAVGSDNSRATVGLGVENAARWLRSQIGVPA